jgi:hypothetical protein
MLNSPNSAQARDNDLFKHAREVRGLTYLRPAADSYLAIFNASKEPSEPQAYEKYGLTPPSFAS